MEECGLYSLSSLLFFFIFFFKQKTAYEMRISDWSSDVCSSDLLADIVAAIDEDRFDHAFDAAVDMDEAARFDQAILGPRRVEGRRDGRRVKRRHSGRCGRGPRGGGRRRPGRSVRAIVGAREIQAAEKEGGRSARSEKSLRSEEHTSELQS